MKKRYTTEHLQRMKERRDNVKSAYSGLSDKKYRNMLGRIRAAGHFEFTSLEEATVAPINDHQDVAKISFMKERKEGSVGERPHIKGYVESPNPDKGPLKIVGWWNPATESFRFEITDKYPD